MRGRKKQYRVHLHGAEGDLLRRTASSRKAPHGEVMRARALLCCVEHPDWSDQRVATEVGCCDRTVRKWRKRWYEKQSVEEAPRSGRPRVFSPRGPGSSHGVGVQLA